MAIGGDLEDGTRELLAGYLAKAGVRGAALCVTLGGKPILSVSAGTADGAGMSMTPKTRFAAGSIAKTFAALAFLILQREGRLSLDDTVSHYIPAVEKDPSFVIPPAGGHAEPIRLRHLLSHSSGIPELGYVVSLLFRLCGVEGQGPYSPDDPESLTAGLIEAARERLAPPGTRFLYSNENYVLLAAVIEIAAGIPFEEVVRTRILEPLGMTESSIGLAQRIGAPIAHGFVPGASGPRRVSPVIPKAAYGPGGLVTTVSDLGCYLAFLQGTGKLGGADVGGYGPRMWKGLLPREGFPGLSYGLGWYVEEGTFDEPLVYHGGDLLYSGGIVALLPQKGIGIAIGQNAAGSQALGTLARDILRLIIGTGGSGRTVSGVGVAESARVAGTVSQDTGFAGRSGAEDLYDPVPGFLAGRYLTRNEVYEAEVAFDGGELILRPRIPGAGWAPGLRFTAERKSHDRAAQGEIAAFRPAGPPESSGTQGSAGWRGSGCEFYRSAECVWLRYENCLFRRRDGEG